MFIVSIIPLFELLWKYLPFFLLLNHPCDSLNKFYSYYALVWTVATSKITQCSSSILLSNFIMHWNYYLFSFEEWENNWILHSHSISNAVNFAPENRYNSYCLSEIAPVTSFYKCLIQMTFFKNVFVQLV